MDNKSIDLNKQNKRRRPRVPSVTKSIHKSSPQLGVSAGITNLKPKCEKTLRLIVSNVENEVVIKHERDLWNQVKEYRNENDNFLINYLIGFYVSLYETIMIYPSRKEQYMLLPSRHSSLPAHTQLLVYNILIRVGDLHRYIRNTSMAETYYHQARKLDVSRGHAYNQLAILSQTPINQYKCIYYSVRAVRASQDPIVMAENNIKMAISKFDNKLLKKVFKMEEIQEEKSEVVQENEISSTQIIPEKYLPSSAIDWFYLSVICVHADHFKSIIKPLTNALCLLCQDEDVANNNDLDFTLMALDVMLDWITIRNGKKSYGEEFAKEWRSVKAKLQEFSDAQNTVNDNKCVEEDQQDQQSNALFHDYVLAGFEPFKEMHLQLKLKEEEESQIERMPLMVRVSGKLEKAFGKMIKPKKIRNVALGSILNRE